MTDDSKPEKKQTQFYGTASVTGDGIYVTLDGSEISTPVSMATDAQTGDRVLVEIVDHTARIIQIVDKSSSDVIADHIAKDEIGVFKDLRAATAYTDTLVASDITADSIVADRAEIEELQATKAYVKELEAENITAESIVADRAEIKNLKTDKLSATDADLKYANIDFSNIGKAAMEYFYATSGLIKDVTVGDQTITGHLVGVTISGDLIEGNTIKAEKLVVKGEDGLYYKLNIEGGSTTTEEITKEDLQNGLDGRNIIAKSITATQIKVDDLVAFDATIGGFNIGDDSIYSGVKSSIDNTTRGIYMDNTGQIAFGDSSNYLKYFLDEDGYWKLEIAAKTITFGGGSKSVEEVVEEMKTEMETMKDEITCNLRIESSRGTVFKNNAVSTVLSAVIYRGSQRITDMATLKSAMGSSAYLQWSWQRLDETNYGIIAANDSRIGNNGFTFTLSPEDVDTKVTFMCELIT